MTQEGSAWGDTLTLQVIDGKTGELKRWIQTSNQGTLNLLSIHKKMLEAVKRTLGEK